MKINNQQYKLLIFDWDGTLMDSAEKIVSCYQQSLQDFDYPAAESRAVKNLIGLSRQDTFRHLLPEAGEVLIERLAQRYSERYVALKDDGMPFFDGVSGGLAALKEQGYWLSVATGKSRRGLKRLIDKYEMHDLFVTTRCADEARSKPHPQMLLDVLDQTGLYANECVMIGDTSFDMEMARSADMPAVGVTYGSHEKDVLVNTGANVCFDDFSSLVDHFTAPNVAVDVHIEVSS